MIFAVFLSLLLCYVSGERIPRFPSLERELKFSGNPMFSTPVMMSEIRDPDWVDGYELSWELEVATAGCAAALYLNGFLADEVAVFNRQKFPMRYIQTKGKQMPPMSIGLYFADEDGIFSATSSSPPSSPETPLVSVSSPPSPHFPPSDGLYHLEFSYSVSMQEANPSSHHYYYYVRAWCLSDLGEIEHDLYPRSWRVGEGETKATPLHPALKRQQGAAEGERLQANVTFPICCENPASQIVVVNECDIPVALSNVVDWKVDCAWRKGEQNLERERGQKKREDIESVAELVRDADHITSGNYFSDRTPLFGFPSLSSSSSSASCSASSSSASSSSSSGSCRQQQQQQEVGTPSPPLIFRSLASLYTKYATDIVAAREAAKQFCEQKGARCRQGTDDIEGEILYMRMREFDPQLVLEVAPDNGYSSSWILRALKENNEQQGRRTSHGGHEIAVDLNDLSLRQIPPPLLSMYSLLTGNACDPLLLEKLEAKIKQQGVRVDYLHIDADHTAEFADWVVSTLLPLVFPPHSTPASTCLSMSIHDVFHGLLYSTNGRDETLFASHPTFEGTAFLNSFHRIESDFNVEISEVFSASPFLHTQLWREIQNLRKKVGIAQGWNDDLYLIQDDYVPRRNSMLFLRICKK